LEVSDPGGPYYGQYLSIDEVAALAAPAPESVRVVTEWLRSHGLEPTVSRSGDWVELANAQIAAVSEALATSFFEFEAEGSDRRVHRAPAGAVLPLALREHVDDGAIFPLKVLPPRGSSRRRGRKGRRRSVAAPIATNAEEEGAAVSSWPRDCTGLATAGMITPAVIRQRYNITGALDTRGLKGGTRGSMASALPYDDSDGCGFLQRDVFERDELCGLGSGHKPVEPKGDAAHKFNKKPCNCVSSAHAAR
jgi:hypothetical protein